MRILSGLAGISLACVTALSPAMAQNAKVAEVANYAGADRTQKLIEAAKKEGVINLYTSQTVQDMTVLKTAFEAKYPGVKINLWRSSSEDIVHRSVTEYGAKRYEVDAFETDQSGLEALHREKLLQAIKSPVIDDLVPQAAAPKEWLGTRLQIITAAVNTKSIPQAEWPKTYEDLLDPKWKGKIAVESGDADWFATVVESMGEAKGLKLFRDISEKNGFQVRKGHTLLANLIAAGEVPFAVTTYMFRVRQLNKSGAPVAPVLLQPAVARVNGIGLAANSPHPNATILFMDWLLSDGQEILSNHEFFSTNKKYSQTPPGLEILYVNAAEQIDQGEKWEKLFNEIVLKKRR
ncbi:MAG: Iron(III) transport system substrate-binding protein [Hyphomicrobiales bacterium]|jgi:iron(III) transport system substrate-binding protein|nr:Iron(III) transport system substrate-binding protein [Hyphomicrobiales bacterium]